MRDERIAAAQLCGRSALWAIGLAKRRMQDETTAKDRTRCGSAATPRPTAPSVTAEVSAALLAALAPAILFFLTRAMLVGWGHRLVDISILGSCCFAVTLVAAVRIASHGRGREWLLLMVVLGILQVLPALFFSGAFSDKPSAQTILKDVRAVHRMDTTPPRPADLRMLDSDLQSYEDSSPTPSDTAYGFVAASGVLSALALARFWAPLESGSANWGGA